MLFGQPRVRARAPPPCCGRLQARWRVELLPRISPFAIDLRAPFAARLEARALRRSCAHTPKLGQLVPAARIDGAERARARAVQVRRRRRRRSALRGATGAGCLDLRLDTHGGGDGGGDISYLCSTPSSCDGVECVFAFPTGARAIGRVGARRFERRLQRRPDGDSSKRKHRRIARRCG